MPCPASAAVASQLRALDVRAGMHTCFVCEQCCSAHFSCCYPMHAAHTCHAPLPQCGGVRYDPALAARPPARPTTAAPAAAGGKGSGAAAAGSGKAAADKAAASKADDRSPVPPSKASGGAAAGGGKKPSASPGKKGGAAGGGNAMARMFSKAEEKAKEKRAKAASEEPQQGAQQAQQAKPAAKPAAKAAAKPAGGKKAGAAAKQQTAAAAAAKRPASQDSWSDSEDEDDQPFMAPKGKERGRRNKCPASCPCCDVHSTGCSWATRWSGCCTPACRIGPQSSLALSSGTHQPTCLQFAAADAPTRLDISLCPCRQEVAAAAGGERERRGGAGASQALAAQGGWCRPAGPPLRPAACSLRSGQHADVACH